ncbi:SDR family oxidoreductase [Silvibacterium sp.]|uniref:SDR family oxidoreductase n=1 Tax=Silvibacterium sp. TaxID=1964179 RepID=UPI0039E64286
MSKLLANKIAIVTGAGRGIGAAIARRFAAEGASVVVNYARSQAEAEAVVSSIQQAGGRAVAVQGDVSTREGAAAAFNAAEQHFGKPDILINNAGLILYKPVAAVSEEEYDRLFAVNVKGTFLTSQLAVTRLNDGGSIINFSSSTTALMLPTYAIYVATKGAVEQFSHVLAKELGSRKIRVNVVSPGPVDTDLFNQGKTEEDRKRMASLAAFNRLGTPEDIAGVVTLLVSDDAAWISGQNIRANGGLI